MHGALTAGSELRISAEVVQYTVTCDGLSQGSQEGRSVAELAMTAEPTVYPLWDGVLKGRFEGTESFLDFAPLSLVVFGDDQSLSIA